MMEAEKKIWVYFDCAWDAVSEATIACWSFNEQFAKHKIFS